MAGFRPNSYFIDVLTRLGMTTNLMVCLDAGDGTSYTSGQTWTDRSGNGYSFFRGADSGSAADDPTFNGSAGAKSTNEYFSSDGGDYFRLNQANPTWVQNIHKDNAIFSIMMWVYHDTLPSVSGNFTYLAGTAGGTTGFEFVVNTGDNLQFLVFNATALPLNVGNSVDITADTWQLYAVTVNEASNATNFYVNTSNSLSNGTYTSPATGNASYTLEFLNRGNAFNPAPTGIRTAFLGMWGGTALSSTQISNFYNYSEGFLFAPRNQAQWHVLR